MFQCRRAKAVRGLWHGMALLLALQIEVGTLDVQSNLIVLLFNIFISILLGILGWLIYMDVICAL